DRPHVRLGVLWFGAAVGALVIGPPGVAAVFGGAAALGAAQAARAWRRAGRRAGVVVAAVLGGVLPVAAALASWGLGAAILVGVAASVVTAAGDSRRILADGATTVRCWFFVGLGAATVVTVSE